MIEASKSQLDQVQIGTQVKLNALTQFNHHVMCLKTLIKKPITQQLIKLHIFT